MWGGPPAEIFVSVFVPPETVQVISTWPPIASPRPDTADCSSVGIVHVTPAAAIVVEVMLVIAPLTLIWSGFGAGTGWHPPGSTSTASPPLVPPPSLPFVKPPVVL